MLKQLRVFIFVLSTSAVGLFICGAVYISSVLVTVLQYEALFYFCRVSGIVEGKISTSGDFSHSGGTYLRTRIRSGTKNRRHGNYVNGVFVYINRLKSPVKVSKCCDSRIGTTGTKRTRRFIRLFLSIARNRTNSSFLGPLQLIMNWQFRWECF